MSDKIKEQLRARDLKIEFLLEEIESRDARIRQLKKDQKVIERRLGQANDDNAALRATVEELEQYIDKRQSQWLNRDDEVAGHLESIATLEQTVQRQQVELQEAQQEKEALSLRIVELERASGVAKKRDSAVREALDAERSTIADLEAELLAIQEGLELLTVGENNAENPDTGATDILEAAADAELLAPEIFLTDEQREEGLSLTDPALPVARKAAADSHHEGPIRKLIVMIQGEEQTRYPIFKDEVTIGRSKRADIRVNDHYVSRVHAKIRTLESETVLEDVGSKNGLWVNAEPCARCTLHDGDLVSVGEVQLRFVDLDERSNPEHQ